MNLEDDREKIVIGLCICGIVLGLLFCFLGYRLLRPTLLVVGFTVGAGVTYCILHYHTTVSTPWILIVAPLLAGIFLAAVASFVLHVGIGLIGLVFGFLIVTQLIALKDGGLFSHNEIIQWVLLGIIF